jgi:hypothetical protein
VPVADVGVTDAVNLTLCPKVDGFTLDDTVVLLAVFPLTTWLIALDVDTASLVSPP